MKIKIKNTSKYPNPSYETRNSSGMDIRANLVGPIYLAPSERKLIKTGIFLDLPEGYEVQIRPRSGLALKQGITVLNSPGTIDADYKGEIGVILINHSNNIVIVNDGDRVAQMVINKVTQVVLENVKELSESERGAGGFGHTGIK